MTQISLKQLKNNHGIMDIPMGCKAIKTMLCPIKVNSNTIELTMHTSCYCIQDLNVRQSDGYCSHKQNNLS